MEEFPPKQEFDMGIVDLELNHPFLSGLTGIINYSRRVVKGDSAIH